MKQKNLDRVLSAVVQVHVEGFLEGEEIEILDPREIRRGHWAGSGVLVKINDEEGYILTNAHVVKNGLTYRIRTMLTSEEDFQVKLVGMIETLEPDIGLLKILDSELVRMKAMIHEIPFLELEREELITRDLSIKAVGYPFGMEEPNVSNGKVTNFIFGSDDECERIVTDTPINPGNSGGPSVSESGKIIGINTSIILGANDIGFITPISFVKIVMQNLTEGKETDLTNLGGRFQKNSKEISAYLKAPTTDGVIVTTIFPNGLLSKAGFMAHDILYKINEYEFDAHGIVKTQSVSRHRNIFDVVRLIPLHSKIELTFIREGKIMSKIAEALPFPEQQLRTTNNLLKRHFISFKGMIIQEINFLIVQALAEISPGKFDRFIELLARDKRKLCVTFVSSNSYADDINIVEGDIISKINGLSVLTMIEAQNIFNEKIAKGEEIIIDFESGALGIFKGEKSVKVITPVDMLIDR